MGEYDGVCPHADLGDWGVEGDRGGRSTCSARDDDASPGYLSPESDPQPPEGARGAVGPGAWRRLAESPAPDDDAGSVIAGTGDD